MFTPVAEHLICFAKLFYDEKRRQHLQSDDGVSDARDHSHPSHDIRNVNLSMNSEGEKRGAATAMTLYRQTKRFTFHRCSLSTSLTAMLFRKV